MNRGETLQSLLEESLAKIEYLLVTPSDEIWLSKVTDFQVSCISYLKTGNLSNEVYNHKVLREKKDL
jgi:hypothetical protein